ncbi:MAG: mannose-1-phosphate guanylyltransferase [Chloroflexota bacterium]|nr:mannose-1-phosphate guanylyltransferase [Chloroflexota bacterium]
MTYALIMAGGIGSRLWPLSRLLQPKQSLKLVGERTMMQHAVDRIIDLTPPEQVYVVTRAEHVDILSGQVPDLPRTNFIVEPEGRGTAPAIGLAAIHLRRQDPTAVMAVLTADHFIADTEQFRQALAAAVQVASQEHLVTLGISPTSPSTGFGYIEQGELLAVVDGFEAFRAVRFTEKPDLETANWMVDSGNFSWNSGMFIWQVDRILGEFERQMPEFYAQLKEIEPTIGTADYEQVLDRVWPEVAKQTIDYGIMEDAGDVAVIPVDIGWSDVGSWGSLLPLLNADEQGNIVLGKHLGIDTRDTLIMAEGTGRLIATIGLDGMIIIDTKDALLICPRGREQEVRDLVKHLETVGTDRWL